MANIYTDIAMFDAELYLAKNPDVAAAIEAQRSQLRITTSCTALQKA